MGPEGAGWEEASPKVTWAWVSAGDGQLVNPNPVSEAERLENRRVVLVFSNFEITA